VPDGPALHPRVNAAQEARTAEAAVA
jgi:hypothetical protein